MKDKEKGKRGGHFLCVAVTGMRVGVEPIPTITNMFKLFTCARSLLMKDVARCIMILKFMFNGKNIGAPFIM
jgi:hypothetical protein